MKINNKLDLMHELNKIEKDIKCVKSVIASSSKQVSESYDYSMTTEDVNNLSVIVARLEEEITELKY